MSVSHGFKQFLQPAKHSQDSGKCMVVSYGPQLMETSLLTVLRYSLKAQKPCNLSLPLSSSPSFPFFYLRSTTTGKILCVENRLWKRISFSSCTYALYHPAVQLQTLSFATWVSLEGNRCFASFLLPNPACFVLRILHSKTFLALVKLLATVCQWSAIYHW